jgi:hypothetical protein
MRAYTIKVHTKKVDARLCEHYILNYLIFSRYLSELLAIFYPYRRLPTSYH